MKLAHDLASVKYLFSFLFVCGEVEAITTFTVFVLHGHSPTEVGWIKCFYVLVVTLIVIGFQNLQLQFMKEVTQMCMCCVNKAFHEFIL